MPEGWICWTEAAQYGSLLSAGGVAVWPRDERHEIADADVHRPDAFATSDGSVCVYDVGYLVLQWPMEGEADGKL